MTRVPPRLFAGWSAEAVRRAERPLLEAGVPLMRRAAHALAAEIATMKPASVLVLVGSGDNGADALYAAAELSASGVSVHAVATSTRVHADARAHALTHGVMWSDESDVVRLGRASDVIVDGILGIGSRGPLTGDAREVVGALLPLAHAEHPPRVVAVDLPSGIGVDDGSVADPTVLPADVTVTFGAVKAGLLLPPASALVGRIVLVDLGLDRHLVGEPILVP